MSGAPQKILIIGPTGIDKKTVISKLLAHCQNSCPDITFEHIDFERDCVLKANNYELSTDYYAATYEKQCSDWANGLQELKNEHSFDTTNTILLMHTVISRLALGVGSPINITSLLDVFKPDVVITLIDDIYAMWQRVWSRVKKEYTSTLAPNPDQLMHSRRCEIMMGDKIATRARAKHYVLALRHPIENLRRLALPRDRQRLKTVYLSFPITKPRQWQENPPLNNGESDPLKLINEVNQNLLATFNFQRNNDDIVFICPLSIDEYPFKKATVKERIAKFSINTRWDDSEFYRGEELMYDHICVDSVEMPLLEWQRAEGMVGADVAARDYQLAKQCSHLLVCSPIMQDARKNYEYMFARGVKAEIRHATQRWNKPVLVYQPHSDEPAVAALLTETVGSMGETPSQALVKQVAELSEAFERIVHAK